MKQKPSAKEAPPLPANPFPLVPARALEPSLFIEPCAAVGHWAQSMFLDVTTYFFGYEEDRPAPRSFKGDALPVIDDLEWLARRDRTRQEASIEHLRDLLKLKAWRNAGDALPGEFNVFWVQLDSDSQTAERNCNRNGRSAAKEWV